MLSFDEKERRRRREEAATYVYDSPQEQRVAEQQALKEQKHYAQVASDLDTHMRQNGEFYTKTVKDRSGRTVTQQWWRGTRADGTQAKDQMLRSAYGKHSLSAFASGTLDLKTDNYTRRFNQGAAYLLQRNVAYQMDPYERKLTEKMEADRAYKLAKFDRENPIVRSGDATPQGGQKAQSARDSNRETYEGSYWDRDNRRYTGYVVEADRRWKAPNGGFATREQQTLYELGVDKSEWEQADRAGRKQILKSLYQNEGVNSTTSRYVRSRFAQFIRGANLDQLNKAQDTVNEYRNRVDSTAIDILGKEAWQGMDREAKKRFRKALVSSNSQLAAGFDAYRQARAFQRQVADRASWWGDDTAQYKAQQARTGDRFNGRYT